MSATTPPSPTSHLAPLAAELYDFLLAAERALPSLAPGGPQAQLVERARSLQAAMADVRARASERAAELLDEAHHHLNAFAAALKARMVDAQQARASWAVLGRTYEALRAHVARSTRRLPPGVSLGHIKPTNLARNAFHVTMALIGIAVYELTASQTVVVVISSTLLALFIALDVARRSSERFNAQLVRTVFGKISRPGEAHRVPAATWYMLGLCAGVILLPQHAIELGVLILGVGDPLASLAGKRFGRLKLVGEKSLAGTLAFVGAAMAASAIFVAWLLPPLGASTALLLITAPALAGAITELFSGPIDDNLTIPLVAGAVAAAILAAG